jgi:ParB family chromosome partitioning protein
MVTKKSGMAAKLEGKTANLGNLLDTTPNTSSPISSAPPVTMPGQLGAFRLEAQRYHQRITELEAELKKAKEEGGALEIRLDELVEVEGRRRQLSPEAFVELKENLRQHDLITPITVRVLEDGRYEVVSGHNRVAVYRELGRPTIKAWLADSDADKTEELAFYANLLHPDLTAFEKYIGLKKVRSSNPTLTTLSDLAQRTGLSKSLVGELFSFDELPEEALALLSQKPGALGSKAISQLVSFIKEGKTDQVLFAIRKAVEEDLEQQEVLRLANTKPSVEKQASPRPQARTIRSGRKTYCNIIGTRKTIRLEFQSEEDRIEAEAMLEDLLKTQAERRKELE